MGVKQMLTFAAIQDIQYVVMHKSDFLRNEKGAQYAHVAETKSWLSAESNKIECKANVFGPRAHRKPARSVSPDQHRGKKRRWMCDSKVK